MALLFMDGFEGYQDVATNMLEATFNPNSTGFPGKWVSKNGLVFSTGNLNTTQPSGYSRSLQFPDENHWCCLSIPTTTELYVGCRVKFPSGTMNTNNLWYISETNGGTPTTGLKITVSLTGIVRVQSADGVTTHITTAAGVIVTGTTYYNIELKVIYSATVGSIELRINGTSYNSAANIDTTGGMAGGGFTNITFKTSLNTTTYYDDLYVCDGSGTTNNTFLGNINIYTLWPMAAGTTTQFTAVGAANNYSAVGVGTWSAARYNKVNATSNLDLYNVTDIAGTPTSINAISVTHVSSKKNTAAHSIRNKVKVGANTSNGTSNALTNNYLKVTDVFTTQPDGSAWTVSTINSMEVGTESL